MKRPFNAHDIVDQLAAIYDESVTNLRQALARYVEDRSAPDPKSRKRGVFAYPELRIDYSGKLPVSAPARAELHPPRAGAVVQQQMPTPRPMKGRLLRASRTRVRHRTAETHVSARH